MRDRDGKREEGKISSLKVTSKVRKNKINRFLLLKREKVTFKRERSDEMRLREEVHDITKRYKKRGLTFSCSAVYSAVD